MDYLSEYNRHWPAWFSQIEQYLQPQLMGILRIEHIGSTSIIGMAAKPIIDIDLVVPDGAITNAVTCIEATGYVHRRDLDVPGREAFLPVSPITKNLPTHHLYACEVSSMELHRHIAFREYLRAHPIEAVRLTDFKRYLAFERHLSRSEYIEAKSPLVVEIIGQALTWYGPIPGGKKTNAHEL